MAASQDSVIAKRTEGDLKAWQLDAVVDAVVEADAPEPLFKDLEMVGHGATADIVKAIDVRTQEVVAVKKFKNRCKNKEDFEDIIKEIKFLRSCTSPYLVNHLGSYFSQSSRVWIVMEFCLGSCFDVIQGFKRPLQEDEIRAVCLGVLKGLEYLHQNQKIHRDIKSRNILLAEGGLVKLADFGASADLAGGDGRCNTFIGSPYWLAPEVIMAMETGSYSYPVDIWSLGITLLELAETKPPLFHMQAMSALFHIPQQDPPTLSTPGWSSDFSDFLSHALVLDPDERRTATQLLKHKFVAGVEAMAQDILMSLINRSMDAVRGEIDLSGIEQKATVIGSQTITEEDEDGPDAGNVAEQEDEDQDQDEEEQDAQSLSASTLEDAHPTNIARHSTDDESADTSVGRKASKYNTVKLPSTLMQDAKESKDAANAQIQMKAIRKVQKKQAEAAKQLGKTQNAELMALTRKLGEQRDELRRQHEKLESIQGQEQDADLSRLLGMQQATRKRHEADLKKIVKKREKESKNTRQAKISELGREAKRAVKEEGSDKKESAKKLKADSAAIEARIKSEFESAAAVFTTAAMRIMRARQEVEEAKMKFGHLNEEQELKQKNLQERVEMAAEHKTGSVHSLYIRHLEQQQELELEYQSERQEMEMQHLNQNHTRAASGLQKRHATQSKAYDRKMKKLSIRDETVQEAFRRNTAVSGELRDMQDRKAADKRLAKKLEKMEKEALTEARHSVVMNATIKLNQQQVKEFAALRTTQDAELKELSVFLEQRRQFIQRAHEKSQKELEARLKAELEAAKKYKEMEMENFLHVKNDTLQRAETKLKALIQEKEELVTKEQARLTQLGPAWDVVR